MSSIRMYEFSSVEELRTTEPYRGDNLSLKDGYFYMNLPGFFMECSDSIQMRAPLGRDNMPKIRLDAEMMLIGPNVPVYPLTYCADMNDTIAKALDSQFLCQNFITFCPLTRVDSTSNIFVISDAYQASHLLVVVQRAPDYPSAAPLDLDDEFARRRGVVLSFREPNKTEEERGFHLDLLLLDLKDADVDLAGLDYSCQVMQETAENTWRRFDAERAYYRRQLERYAETFASFGMKSEWCDDYVRLRPIETERNRELIQMLNFSSDVFWYEESDCQSLISLFDKIESGDFFRSMLGFLLS